MRGVFLIGYDVESGEPDVTARFLERVRVVHEVAGVPATLFVVGRTALRHGPALRELAAHPLFDVQQHTFSHVLLKTVCQENEEGVRVFPGGSLQEAADDVRRGQQALREACGVTCTGLTGPYNYYRGLSDRPDLLRACRDEGIRFLRCDGRDAHDWQPVPLDRQPYWYGPQGFPDLLECCLHGWQDCILRERLGWERTREYVAAVEGWIREAARRGLVYSYCQHDWSSLRADPTLAATAEILTAAKSALRCLSYRDFYAERLAAR